jgi:hypothetical protein
MPSNEEHSESTYKKFGHRASELHRWMDDPWKTHGDTHRKYRHDPSQPPEWAVKLYGCELTQKIMRDHVELDILVTREKIGFTTEYSVLEADEDVIHVLKTKATDYVVTNQQFIVIRQNSVISFHLADITHLKEETRRNPVGLSIAIMGIGIVGLFWFVYSGYPMWTWGVSMFLILVGFYTFNKEEKVLILTQTNTPKSMEFVINAPIIEIENLIQKITDLK